MKTRLFVALSALGLCSFAAADTDAPWAITSELGIIATSGNTEATTLQGKLDVRQNMPRWHNHYIFTALFKEDQITDDDGRKSSEKTAEKYFGSAKSAYQLERDNANFFVFGSHANDQFGSYRKYSTFAIGYGTRVYESETMKLDAEIGPGYFRAERAMADESTQTESGTLIRGAASFRWQVSTTAEFTQTLSVESAEENTRTVAESALTTRINSAMQLKVGLNIANDSDVAPPKEKTDMMSYVNLVYKFR